MGWIGDVGQFIQVLIGVITLIGTLVKIIQEIQKLIQERKIKNTKGIQHREAVKDALGAFTNARYLDLAVVLISAVFFSLVLVDALVISGRSPDIIYSLLATLLICVCTTSILAFLWFRNKAEAGIGWAALITLILLVVAPGGPFLSDVVLGNDIGLNLWLPVSVLSFLAIAMWIYEYGHPLDRTISHKKKWGVSLFLVFVTLVGTISVGKQIQRYIQNDPRTPNLKIPAVKNLLDEINSWNRAQKSAFYATISDTYLVGTYYDYYQSVQVDLSSELNNKKYIKNSIQAFLTTKLGNSALGQDIVDFSLVADKLVSIIDNGGNEQDINKFLIDDIKLAEKYQVSIEKLNEYSIEIYQKRLDIPSNILRINQILIFFSNLPEEQQKLYLANRVKWMHATGGKTETLKTTELPGITPEHRYSQLSEDVIDHALSLQYSKVGALCSEFNYSSSITDKYCEKKSNTLVLPNPFVLQDTDAYQADKSIFPVMERYPFSDRFQEQLSLPINYEAYLAYSEYALLGRKVALQKAGNKARASFKEIFDSFDHLSSEKQVTFIYYLINYSNNIGLIQNSLTKQDIYKTLLNLSQKNIHFVTNDGQDIDDSNVRILVGMIEQGSTIDPTSSLSNLASKIQNIQSQDEKEAIRRFLSIQDPRYPVRYLLGSDVLSLVQDLDTLTTEEQRVEIFRTISNPMSIVTPNLLEPNLLVLTTDFPANITQGDISRFFGDANQTYEKFLSLDNKQQQNLLHSLAISLYDAQGQYSHTVIGLMIAQANSWTEESGLLVASIVYFPISLIIFVLASYASKQLSARDRLKQLISDESSQLDNWQFTIGTPDIIHGRMNIITRLKNLASRGWGSIAVVGRRGVGKTRVLLELLQQKNSLDQPKALTAWIATPSQFEEAELIESVLERLTANVENAIARHLGAKPLEVRRLEMNDTIIGSIVYAIMIVILLITFSFMSNRVASDQIISTWFPVFLVFLISGIFLIAHFLNMQPVDLSSWLERDRSSSPHTVLLYRDAKRVLQFLENRKKQDSKDIRDVIPVQQFIRWLGILLFGTIFIFAVSSSSSSDNSQVRLIVSLISAVIVSGLLAIQPFKNRLNRGYSLLSLIAEYRGFIDRTVFRIRHGALGMREKDDFEIIVCIDELDKIIVPSELLAFVRRMKVIFEIPGAYYFLSISEDALNALYLGAAEGKNEIDSTFDHIVRIPPVDCDLGEKIACTYLDKHSTGTRNQRIDRTIASISFGIPRDIIRRCDELLANGNANEATPSLVSDDLRMLQVKLAYSEDLVTKKELVSFCKDAHDSIKSINNLVSKNEWLTQNSIPVVLSIWVLILISLASKLNDDKWHVLSESLRDIGYRILDERSDILIDELNVLQQEIIECLAINEK